MNEYVRSQAVVPRSAEEKAISSQVLGGMAEMRSSEDEDFE
jgi:hypothetical protein